MRIFPLVAWASLLLPFVSVVVGQETGQGKVFVAAEADKVFVAAARVSSQREQVSQRLIEIADGSDGFPVPEDKGAFQEVLSRRFMGSKARAIALLGELRAEEAVPVLMRNLTYEVAANVGGYGVKSDLAVRYPCTKALVAIGLPAVRPLVRKVLEPSDELERELALFALVRIQGVNVTRRILQEKIKSGVPVVCENGNKAFHVLDEKYGPREDLNFDPW